MKKKLLQILACPICKADLTFSADSKAEEVENGSLLCSNQHRFPVKNFVPLFGKEEKYNDAFAFIHAHPFCMSLPPVEFQGSTISMDELTEKEFVQQTGFNPSELRDKLVMDAGCSVGRFISFLRKQEVGVIGVDLQSGALQKAASQFRGEPQSAFIQANLLQLPFRENAFDFIFSLGVLHHTPDPKQAFMNLVRCLKKGGKIAIWVYPKYPRTLISDFLRPVTTRLPHRLLLVLGLIITTLYSPFLKIPRIEARLKPIFYRVRIPWHKHWKLRMHSFMDWYAPKYQFKYTNEEIRAWFEEAGLINIQSFAYGTSAQGTKA